MPVLKASGLAANVFGSPYAKGMSCAGMYTRCVCGLNDMGCQLCAPSGPGIANHGLCVSP